MSIDIYKPSSLSIFVIGLINLIACAPAFLTFLMTEIFVNKVIIYLARELI